MQQPFPFGWIGSACSGEVRVSGWPPLGVGIHRMSAASILARLSLAASTCDLLQVSILSGQRTILAISIVQIGTIIGQFMHF
jgi:hypothetical protein